MPVRRFVMLVCAVTAAAMVTVAVGVAFSTASMGGISPDVALAGAGVLAVTALVRIVVARLR
jgi:multisubunit Na+/H+ antiporter MnhB subunit